MTGRQRTRVAWRALLAGSVGLALGPLPAAAQEPTEDAIKMIVDLVSDADRDMRALGLQQVREEARGEKATRRFAELLAKLAPEAQASLLEALGDRGDPVARPAVVEMLKSREEGVRVAALRALGNLGSEKEVRLLAEKAAAGPEREKAAARASLVRLRGEGASAAILAAMRGAAPGEKAVLLGVLADRHAAEALAIALESAVDPDPAVRLAALGALRGLADQRHIAALIKVLKAAKDNAERRAAESALLAVCGRAREKCTAGLVTGMAEPDGAVRAVLLRALGRAGGAKALEAVVARLSDADVAVGDEALRVLSNWPDSSAASHLLAAAQDAKRPQQEVLAIRGLVRLGGAQKGKPADVKLLGETLKLAKRPAEKRLVLGALGGIATPESLELLVPLLDDAGLCDEAALAVVMIAEQMKGGDRGKLRGAVEKARSAAKDPQVRERVQSVLQSLQ